MTAQVYYRLLPSPSLWPFFAMPFAQAVSSAPIRPFVLPPRPITSFPPVYAIYLQFLLHLLVPSVFLICSYASFFLARLLPRSDPRFLFTVLFSLFQFTIMALFKRSASL